MKKITYLALLAALIVLPTAFSSCAADNDDIEEPDVPQGPVITTEVIKTDAEALSLGNGVYGPLQTLSSSFSFLLESLTESTISFEGAETAGGPKASKFELEEVNSYVSKHFNAFYTSIGTSNLVLQKLDSSRVTDKLTQATKDLVAGRVKFTRALSYLYLTQLYGEVPLKLSPADAGKTARNSIDEVYTQIVLDLTEAEELLPLTDIIKSNPSKGAANALLARAYLAWGSKPLSAAEVTAIAEGQTDPAAPSYDNDKLTKAVEYADKVIESGSYTLESNFNNNWGVLRENRSDEHIYTIHHDGDGNGDVQGNHQTHCPFTYRFELWTDNHIGPADVSLATNLYEAGDTRKLYSIVTRLFNSDEVVSTSPTVYKEFKYEFPVTSPRFGRWIHRSALNSEIAPSSAAGQPNSINRIDIRYAEVLLIKAEALLFLGKAGEGLPLVNQLRTRAGVSALSSLTKDNLIKEWKLEFLFEQKNWPNLVRWRALIGTVKTVVPTYEYYKEDYSTNESVIAKAKATNPNLADSEINAVFFAKIYTHLHAKVTNVKGKHYRFPIPTAHVSGTGIAQNPGY